MGLLSPEFVRLSSSRHAPGDLRGRFLAGLAQGSVKGLTPPDSLARAIQPAFDGTSVVLSEDAELLLDQGRIGEAILLAMGRIESGLRGNLPDVTIGLTALRKLGLEDVARHTALELMLLERRG